MNSIENKQQEIDRLENFKNDLKNNLRKAEQEFEDLIEPSGEEKWVSAFPIENLHHLHAGNKLKTRLGDYRKRTYIVNQCDRTLDELEAIDDRIKLLQIELVAEKIKHLLNK